MDTHPGTLHGFGQPAHQKGGLDPRAVRRPAAAEGAGDPHPRGEFAGIEEHRVGIATGLAASARHLAAQPLELRRRAGDAEPPPLDEVGVDALSRRDPGDLGYGVAHREVQLLDARPVAPRRAGEQSADPAAVAARRPEPAELRLEHDDAKLRRCRGEVVRRPQPGVAAADDADVGCRPAAQPRAALLRRRAGRPVATTRTRPRR